MNERKQAEREAQRIYNIAKEFLQHGIKPSWCEGYVCALVSYNTNSYVRENLKRRFGRKLAQLGLDVGKGTILW